MNREFLDLYNRELSLLYEQAGEFAEQYPGIAERLGGLIRERTDPMIAGLLEGAAFLAARVQLKLKHEFPEFTANLLEQLVPNYLAPTPSAMLVKVLPPYSDPALRDGKKIARGAYFDATYRERERSIACRYRLCRDIVALAVRRDRRRIFFHRRLRCRRLGVPVGSDVISGLAHLADPSHGGAHRRRNSGRRGAKQAGAVVRRLPHDRASDPSFRSRGRTPSRFTSRSSPIASASTSAISTISAIPWSSRAAGDCLRQIGFDEKTRCSRTTTGYFAASTCCANTSCFRANFWASIWSDCARSCRSYAANRSTSCSHSTSTTLGLRPSVRPETFSLYTAPAINLFEKTTDRIPIKSNTHEYHVVPDRSRYLEYEPHRVLDVYAHFAGGTGQGAGAGRSIRRRWIDPAAAVEDLFFTVRRLPRRRTVEEKARGASSDYTGTDMFISLLRAGEN